MTSVQRTGMPGGAEAPRGPALLVVEDDPTVASALRSGLEGEGYAVSVARTGEDGFFLASTHSFDLIVLDRMLPGREGLEILRALRQKGLRTPVLVLTARGAVDERIEGLDAGADDYLQKPFAFSELLARLRALGRRRTGEPATQLSAGSLVLDLPRRAVTNAGRKVDVTPKEFDLLVYLIRHKGNLVSREMLARDVWHETERCTPLDNVIDVHMARLRRKVDPDDSARLIETVRGVGFIVREEER